MVALAPNTNETPAWDVLDAFPKLHSRAREAKTTPCTEAPMLKSRNCIEIWLTIYESCDRLESFTRDPIGFDGSEWDLYEYVKGNPFGNSDPFGLACQKKCGGYQITTKKKKSCLLFKDDSGWQAGHEFEVDVDFAQTCSCCRFRQYVLESRFKVTLIKADGTSEVITHDVENAPIEDCIKDNNGKVIFCYGDPNQTQNSPDSVFSSNGCNYHMRDTPGFPILEIIRKLLFRGLALPLRIKVEMSISFGFKVEDVCIGGVLGTEEFSFDDCELDFTIDKNGIPRRTPGTIR